MCYRTRRQHPRRPVVASQTRLDGSQPHLGRRQCRVQIHSGPRIHHSNAMLSRHSWHPPPSQKASSVMRDVGDVALTSTNLGHMFSWPLWHRHLKWKPSSTVMSPWRWCRTCGNHSFTIEFALLYGFVYQWCEPSICQKPGTVGNFEILQTLSGTFEILEKVLGNFEILQKFVGIFEIFQTLSVIFEINKIVLGIFEIE